MAVCYVGKYAFVCDVEEEEGILRSKGNSIFIFRLFQNWIGADVKRYIYNKNICASVLRIVFGHFKNVYSVIWF